MVTVFEHVAPLTGIKASKLTDSACFVHVMTFCLKSKLMKVNSGENKESVVQGRASGYHRVNVCRRLFLF